MKVLVVARPGIGGVARVLEAMFRRLPSRGVEGTAVLSGLEGTQMLDVARKHGWDAVRVDMKREVAFFSDALAVAKLRREFPGHDLIHAHAARAAVVRGELDPSLGRIIHVLSRRKRASGDTLTTGLAESRSNSNTRGVDARARRRHRIWGLFMRRGEGGW